MAISIKGAGITLGGIAAFLVLNKALNITKEAVSEISEASKWRSYYKHGDHQYATPPGYAENTFQRGEGGTYVEFESPSAIADRRRRENQEAREQNKTPVDVNGICSTFINTVKAILKTKGIDLDKKEQTEEDEEGAVEPEEEFECPKPATDVKDNIKQLFKNTEEKADDLNETMDKMDDILDETGKDEEE